ncbi:DcrB-related protein, partial [Pseudomonas putida]|nr:DcrB-related protein [Pseudomonas putida]
TVLARKPAQLSSSQPLMGVQIEGYYLNDGRPVYQRQAAFEVAPGRILVFSTTSQADFNGKQNESWLALLNSFQPRQDAAASSDNVTQD